MSESFFDRRGHFVSSQKHIILAGQIQTVKADRWRASLYPHQQHGRAGLFQAVALPVIRQQKIDHSAVAFYAVLLTV